MLWSSGSLSPLLVTSLPPHKIRRQLDGLALAIPLLGFWSQTCSYRPQVSWFVYTPCSSFVFPVSSTLRVIGLPLKPTARPGHRPVWRVVPYPPTEKSCSILSSNRSNEFHFAASSGGAGLSYLFPCSKAPCDPCCFFEWQLGIDFCPPRRSRCGYHRALVRCRQYSSFPRSHSRRFRSSRSPL